MQSIPLMALLLAIWPWSSTQQFQMTASSNVPAANGIVKIEKGKDNGNTRLNIKVTNLADPARLNPPANTYLVWIRPSGGTPEKEGVIRVNKNLDGEFHAVTASKDCDVFITAEQTENAATPSPDEVLQAHVTVK